MNQINNLTIQDILTECMRIMNIITSLSMIISEIHPENIGSKSSISLDLKGITIFSGMNVPLFALMNNKFV